MKFWSKILVLAVSSLSCIAVFQIPVTVADNDAFRKSIQKANLETMQKLIPYVENVNLKLEDGKTALMVASRHGRADIASTLIAKGAQVNAITGNGGTALMFAAVNGDTNTIQLLLQHEAAVDMKAKFDWTALMVAAAKGHANIVQALLNAGADPNVRDVYQWTPLMRTSFSGHASVVQTILSFHRNIQSENFAGKRYQLVDIDAQDEKGATALHHAVTECHADVVQILLVNGATKTITDKFGFTPIERAKKVKCSKAENLLESQ